MTISEKILAKNSNTPELKAGDIVTCSVDFVMSHEGSALVIRKFKEIGIGSVWDNSKIIIPLDHRIPANTYEVATAHKLIREFAKEQNIEHFLDLHYGICHQVLPELGFVLPGKLIVGYDSHSTTYGAFGAFGTGVGASEMAGIWAMGELWLKVPETIKISIQGELPPYVYAKDVILNIIGKLTASGATYKSIEFYGDIIRNFSMSERMTICNMTVEMGAKTGIVPPDEITYEYLKPRTQKSFTPQLSDDDARFCDNFNFNFTNLEPQIACPNSVDNVKNISDVEAITIDQAFIGSCTNGRLDDIEIVAKILNGRTTHKNVRLLVCPASRDVYIRSLQLGYIEKIVKAGALMLNPGCGPCLGAHQGVLADSEVAISSSNRNFSGRMGSTKAEIYLASPAVVAAAAVKGEIINPKDL